MSTEIQSKAQKPSAYRIHFDKLNGLNRASIFGIDQIVACSVEVEGSDIGERGSMGNTPLAWAARNGHEAIVKILLGRDDIAPDKGEDGKTPLLLAARNGHEGVVKTLLGRDDVDPNGLDQYGRTPLWWAARNGHEGVVKLLLGRDDVDPNEPDMGGQTPLLRAAFDGHEEVVKILLGRDGVNPDEPNRYGQTALQVANRHARVIALLQSIAPTTHSTAYA